MLKEISVPKEFEKLIHVGEITGKVFLVKIEFGENKNLTFDIAKSIRERIWPENLNTEKEIDHISACLNAKVSFTKRGTYNIKKTDSDYYIDSLYLAMGKMDGEEYLISFFYGEKQPHVMLTYLDEIFLIKK